MADLLVVALVVGAFALAAAFLVACDRIIGPDERPQRGQSGRDTEGLTSR